MATHQPPSDRKEHGEEFEFVPYEPSLLYPFCLNATAVRDIRFRPRGIPTNASFSRHT